MKCECCERDATALKGVMACKPCQERITHAPRKGAATAGALMIGTVVVCAVLFFVFVVVPLVNKSTYDAQYRNGNKHNRPMESTR